MLGWCCFAHFDELKVDLKIVHCLSVRLAEGMYVCMCSCIYLSLLLSRLQLASANRVTALTSRDGIL